MRTNDYLINRSHRYGNYFLRMEPKLVLPTEQDIVGYPLQGLLLSGRSAWYQTAGLVVQSTALLAAVSTWCTRLPPLLIHMPRYLTEGFVVAAQPEMLPKALMTKTRTVTLLIVIITTCALIISLTDAYPTTEIAAEGNATEETSHPTNRSHLVITNIVKTIEFEVALMEDDGTDVDSENSTEVSTPEYIETDIRLLNVNLLRELVNKATEDDMSTTGGPDEEMSTVEGGRGGN